MSVGLRGVLMAASRAAKWVSPKAETKAALKAALTDAMKAARKVVWRAVWRVCNWAEMKAGCSEHLTAAQMAAGRAVSTAE